jgi:diguanylate cyclase (GGDEF)-like protein/putative nucleotidyltransferase with HDIG domain
MAPVLAEAFELRGRLHCETGNLTEAEQDFLTQQRHARATGPAYLVALGSEHLASLALIRGDAAGALDHLEAAATAFREQGDDPAAIRVLLQLATFYSDLKRWNSAEQALADALPRAQRASDLESLARLELIRAQMAIDRSNVERARGSAERALELARRTENAALAAQSVVMTGIVARELGDLDRALRLFDDAERQGTAVDDVMLLGELACERAEVLARGADHRRTLRALNRAYRILARLLGQTGPVDRARRLRRLEATFLDVARRWAQRIEAVDHDTSGHVTRVADLTCEIARRMGVDPASLFGYRVGAYLHDIGKLAIPATILNKRGRLTADEWATVKRHPAAGAEMLAEADFPWEVRPIVESHHECWDGSGYPHGRLGEEIPLAARIFSVADVYDALVTRRSFKEALPGDEAIEVMRRDVGRQFDPAVFHVFEDVMREGVPIPGVASAASLVPPPPAPPVPLTDDALTGVAEITSWSDRASRMLAERRGTDARAALLLVDIDDFARVNSAYGRLQGDDVLWAVAKVLQRGIRSGDLIGRRGGDEFVVLLPDTAADVAAEIAERLREAVAGLRCARRDAPEETLVLSATIAVASAPQDGESIEALLAVLDRSLFRARREGRNRVALADRSEPERARHQLDFSAFIGREDELRTLVAQLDMAARGEPRFVSVGGEAGIGKTALVRQLEPEVRLRNGWLALGQASADAAGGPLAPWAGAIARIVELGGAGDRSWPALSQLVPGHIPRFDAAGDATPAMLQQEVVAFVRRAARERTLVLVLEDMHLAAPASWAVLDALLTGLDDERLLVIYTMRPEVPAGAVEWRRRLQQHARSTHLQLRRFGQDDVRRWVRAVFHDAAPGDDVARWVYEYAEGVPLLTLHLLRAGCEDGTIWYGGTRWEWRAPDPHAVASGVGWVLERRLDRLSPKSRTILSWAAVMHGALTLELLVSVTGVTESEARTAIDEGLSASILTVLGDPAEGRFGFRHPQLVEACLRRMPERQRQQIHDLAARVLELRSPSAVEAIAAHYHAAGNDAAALAYAMGAAERALGACAHDAALSALQVAQRYTSSSRELAALRVRHAEVAVQAGRYAHAESLCDLALEWLDRQPADAVTVRARRLREWVQFRRGKAAGRVAESLRLQVDDAAATAPAEAASTALVAANCAIERAEWPVAAAFARRALESAVGAHAEPVQADSLLVLGIAEQAETPELGVTRLRQAVDRGLALGDPWRGARALHALGEALARQEASAEGEDLLVTALERARASHHAPLAALVSRSLGILRARQGNFDEARHWLGDAERLFTTMEDEPARVLTLLAGAVALRDAGARERAYAQFDAVARRARDLEIPWMELVATAGAALSNGGADAEGTQARWKRTTELVAEARPDWWFAGRELVDAFAVRMALAAGHPSVAHDLFQRAARRLDGVDAFGSAWLVAECGQELQRAGLRSVERTRLEAADRARRLGFRALAGQLS